MTDQEIAAQNARLGAMLASKGLSPDEVETVMRSQVQPALDEACQLVEAGTDPAQIEFEAK